jgi:ribosomal protein S4
MVLSKEERVEAIKKGSLRKPPEPTPYMGMTFYPQERRLDTAIFRALFASSARQARQFVVHGFVKVNGKKVTSDAAMMIGKMLIMFRCNTRVTS